MYKIIIFYFVLIYHESVCKKNNIGKLELKDVCSRCKMFTDSFSYWFDKTSRGKYEGGDAAWEEAKLKSYAQSEVRLIEIQENLCTELSKIKQDQCYALNEDVEQLLETWWGLKTTDTANFYTWLCIDILKYCCPKNHYGEECKLCPLKNDKTCNGHGICTGEGTRQGNGTCLCDIGYVGSYCEECDKNHFRANVDKCEPCHRACIECHNSSPSACLACAKGWQREVGASSVCSDINECNNPSVCQASEFCVNNEGSYSCQTCDKNCKTCIGVGPLKCNSCDNSKVLMSGKCIDSQLLLKNVYNAIMRIFLYIFLIVVLFFIYQQSKSIASILVLSFSIIIYYIERMYELSILSFILNLNYVVDTS